MKAETEKLNVKPVNARIAWAAANRVLRAMDKQVRTGDGWTTEHGWLLDFAVAAGLLAIDHDCDGNYIVPTEKFNELDERFDPVELPQAKE